NDVIIGAGTTPVTVPALPNRLNVNLPVSSPAGRIAFAILGSDYLVDLELSALQAEGQGEVVSSPRVLTSNQQTAVIEQGVEIPYQEASSSGATTISFKEAVLSLEVTPQITPDDRIIMDLIIKKDSVGELVPAGTGGFIPSIDTRELTTQVLVDNGETVVLGGIYETTQNDTISKVPLLGDIPLLGVLFRTTRTVNSKSELLIFITPRIVDESLSVNRYQAY
ncbi:MAG TPA: type IV pilus secretin PilQ, partial [Gammaproteobacteria bacterium]|nr:type IV pilus secretin PilQ [Gammaproteobacteria bacterium]